MDQARLTQTIRLHEQWLRQDGDGAMAILTGADLRGADLQGANLCYAILTGANLRGADLDYANLRGADLRYAFLIGADLQGADLQGANLTGAIMRGIDMEGADLRGACLAGADLRYAALDGACIDGARLNWNSHDLIAEVLRRAADGDEVKESVASLVLANRQKCWRDFLWMRHPLTGWARSVLRRWVHPDDQLPGEASEFLAGA